MSSPARQTPSVPAPDSGSEFDFLTWFELNRRLIVILLGVLCAVVVGWVVMRAQQRIRKEEAAKELLLLIPPTGPGEAPVAVDAAKMIALGNRFPGTPAGEQAQLLGAGQFFAAGSYAEALAQFSTFQERYPESPFLGVAMLGVAAALEAQGKTNEALAAFDRTIISSDSATFAAQARLAKARLVSADQPAQALLLWEEVLKGPAASTYGEQAALGRSQLLAQHPELIPPATTTNSLVVRPAATNLEPAEVP